MKIHKSLPDMSLYRIHLLLAFFTILLSFASFYFAEMMSDQYKQTKIEEAYTDDLNTTLIVSENVQQTLSKVDTILLFMQMDMESHGSVQKDHKALLDRFAKKAFIDNIVVVDVHGNVTYSALPLKKNINLADNRHFLAQKNNDLPELYITANWVGLATDKPEIYLSHRFNDQNGAFAGVVSIALDQDYLSTVLSTVNLGAKRVTLLRYDGEFLARTPKLTSAETVPDSYLTHTVFKDFIGHDVSSGYFKAPALTDGTMQFGFFHTLSDDYPLVIITTTPEESVLAPILQMRHTYQLLAFAFSLFLLIFILIIRWQIQQQFHIAAEMKKQHKQLEYLSYHDQLTGLFNRYFIDQILPNEVLRADRYHEDLSLIILDLDHFKKINDTFGHPIGDQVLKATAEIAQKQIRESDTLARLGGEEFLILLPQTKLHGALLVAEKIRHAVEGQAHPIAGRITVSAGVAERLEKETFLQWYRRVDDALYHAKENGRNCVTEATDRCAKVFSGMQVEWRPQWNCDVANIDLQHQNLVAIGNQLIALPQDASKESILLLLDSLIGHLVYHCTAEEYMLKKVGYNDFEQHKQIHKSLLKTTFELKRKYESNQLKTVQFFSFIIDDLIIGHIINEDIKYFPLTKNN